MPEVLTQEGFRKYDGLKEEYNSEEKLVIETDTGEQLVCTKEHLLLMENGEFLEAENLTIGSLLYGKKKIVSIKNINEEFLVYDLLNVDGTRSYYTNDLVSHNCIFLDEFAHVSQQVEFWESTYPVISSGDDSKVIITSTPNGMDLFYKIYSEAEQGKNDFFPIKVHWSEHPKRDEKWKETTLKNIGMQQFLQEFEVEFMGSSGTLISGNVLKTLTSQTPLYIRDGLSVFEEKKGNNQYALIADVSRGKGLDYSAFHVIDITSMPYRQVCTYRSNMVTPYDYSGIIYRIAKAYNNAAVLIEINDTGGQVADSLHYDYEYDNIIYTENAGTRGKRISSGFARSKEADRGVRTTKTVKAIGCSMIKLLIEQNQLILNDHNTIQELSRFVASGASYEAEKGSHDDLVMGLVLFGWMSDQQYFKEITDISTLQNLRDLTEEEMDSNLLPTGFINTGHDDFEDVIDLTSSPGRKEFEFF